MPLNWAATAAKATKSPAMVICTLLLHAAWKADGKAFTLSNGALAKAGVNRETKRRVLLNLEAAGLIAVERNHGRSPRVTLKTVTPT
jgi:hypothetical protein